MASAQSSHQVLHAASLAKVVVACALTVLEEAGKLSFSDRVVEHLPYFALRDPVQWEQWESDRAAAHTITIQQMATHTAGMPDVPDEEYG